MRQHSQGRSLDECHQYFLRTVRPAVHDPTDPLAAQAESPGRRVSITKDVPILRIDHISIEGKLLGVWRALYSGGVLDFKEIIRRAVRVPFPTFSVRPGVVVSNRGMPHIRAERRLAMLAKCINRLCVASFRNFVEGKLFQLETDPPAPARGIEYFWLCAECSARMTLRLEEDGTLATTELPDAILGAPRLGLNPVNRENRRFLRRVSFLPRSHPKST